MHTPTTEDLARDLAADLKLCEAATPGPWISDPPWGLPWEVGAKCCSPNGVTVCRTLGDSKPSNCPQRDSEQATIDAFFISKARTALPAWIRRAAALQAFKDWTHAFLDTHGVPHHPPGPHGAEGCRIGDRMDWLMNRLRSTESQRDRLLALLREVLAWGEEAVRAGIEDMAPPVVENIVECHVVLKRIREALQ